MRNQQLLTAITVDKVTAWRTNFYLANYKKTKSAVVAAGETLQEQQRR